MDINFIWNGDALEQGQMESAENDISYTLTHHASEDLSPPVSVHLYHDNMQSLITGVVVNKNDKQLFRVNRNLADRNRTTYPDL